MSRVLLMLVLLVNMYHAFGQSVTAQSEMLKLSQSEFDGSCCWRKLSGEGRFSEAADLIRHYLQYSPHVSNRHSLRWHLGQMYAFAGDNRNAIRAFRSTYSPLYKCLGDEDARGWYYYARGTILFLQNKMPAMEQVIKKWKKHLPDSINLQVLEVMQQHPQESYLEVFNKM